MHIKITRMIEDRSWEPWENDNSYQKEPSSQEEFIIPISSVSLSKVTLRRPNDMLYNSIKYQAHIPNHYDGAFRSKTIIISEEEYKRIEKLLAFNNKKELEILQKSYPETNVREAIRDLQVNEE